MRVLFRSKPSPAAFVGCMMPFMLGVCFLCPSMDCLWHKYHYCPSCNQKVTGFYWSNYVPRSFHGSHVNLKFACFIKRAFFLLCRLPILRNPIFVWLWTLQTGKKKVLPYLHKGMILDFYVYVCIFLVCSREWRK